MFSSLFTFEPSLVCYSDAMESEDLKDLKVKYWPSSFRINMVSDWSYYSTLLRILSHPGKLKEQRWSIWASFLYTNTCRATRIKLHEVGIHILNAWTPRWSKRWKNDERSDCSYFEKQQKHIWFCTTYSKDLSRIWKKNQMPCSDYGKTICYGSHRGKHSDVGCICLHREPTLYHFYR